MKVSFFLAQRFIFYTPEKTIRMMTILAFASIMLGSFALALVAAVMNGFEKETQKTIQGIQPDIIMNAGGRTLHYQKIADILKLYPFVAASSPSSEGHALVKTPDSDEIASLVALMAIQPQSFAQVSRMHTMIKAPEKSDFNRVFDDNKVLIGQTLAHSLAVKPGDAITLLYTNDTDAKQQIMLEQKNVTVGAVYKTGIEEFDSHVILSGFPLFNSMYPDKGVTQVAVKLSSSAQEKQPLNVIKDRFKTLNVFSWKELYPALLSALILEKYAMFFILALITLVASMNIVALLFMYITAKKTEIAVLKTLGLSARDLALLFVFIGVGLSMLAALIGLALAVLASYLLEHYPIISLPEVYYVSHLPAHMDVSIIISVIALVLIISLIASYIPARRVYRLDAAAVLKNIV